MVLLHIKVLENHKEIELEAFPTDTIKSIKEKLVYKYFNHIPIRHI